MDVPRWVIFQGRQVFSKMILQGLTTIENILPNEVSIGISFSPKPHWTITVEKLLKER